MDIYQFAMQMERDGEKYYRELIEKESRQFYLEKANEVEGETQKRLLLKLGEEEQKHEFLMENLVEFITRPETWIENAEWRHLDEY